MPRSNLMGVSTKAFSNIKKTVTVQYVYLILEKCLKYSGVEFILCASSGPDR